MNPFSAAMMFKRATGTFVFVLIFISLSALFTSSLNPTLWLSQALSSRPPPAEPRTTHIVLFQFKHGTDSVTIKEITSKMLGLRKACVHPVSQKSYILSIAGGTDISIEDSQNGITHAFILQFHNNEDRDYYVDEDPAHQEFKTAAGAVLEKAQVIDFRDGIFTNPHFS
ncbi:hypothetical protein K504DRAFT_441454 [Pleomassaria siparia CBS 279.74]|uniref:Stress-response A/B barrel domain-containing protein n=1 Tax=Pleomassaria siparia CBS 279.74 TaxID=1314801 RepID=A0A6G1JWD5_9PLEO|nr:hypothetical protein K504DRAFT_441454 [Pleomassaria siparia CBS 279.74]